MINIGDYVLIKNYPDSQVAGRMAIVIRALAGYTYPYEVMIAGKEHLGICLFKENEVEKICPLNRR